ncbi:MAG: hypothetical protein BroJett040_16150 [Oligoflexia bacterium]|nr:MAG: hypothetical protein BroJett040_16150 [Oligoflexia bacterium]
MKNALLFSFLVLMAAQSFAQMEYRKGLLPPTEEHIRKMKEEFRQIQSVEPNELGLSRINQERRKHRLPDLQQKPRKHGEETIIAPVQNGATGGSTSTTVDTQATLLAVPGVVDNSTLAAFPPVNWQGYLASCVAYSSVYYQLTHNMALLHGRNVKSGDPSLIYSPKFVYNMINGGVDNGSYAYDAFKVLQYHGAPALSDWAYDSNYTQWPTDVTTWRKALTQRVGAVQTIGSMDTATGVSNLKAVLNNGYVVTVATWIDSWSYGTIQNDPNTTTDDTEIGKAIVKAVLGQQGGHMMTIVGYNDEVWVDLNGNGVIDAGEKGAFRLANSWGTGWQDRGFIWVSYDSFKVVSAVSGVNNTGRVRFSQDNSTYHFIPKQNYQPSLVAEMTVSHSKRNQIGLRFGKGPLSSSTPSSYITPGAFRFQGGGLAFDGTTSEVRSIVALDMSDLKGTTSEAAVYSLEVGDSTSGYSASLQGYRMTDGYGNLLSDANDYVYPFSFDQATKLAKVVVSTNPNGQNPPLAPSGFTVTQNPSSPSTSLILKWTDNSADESGFVLERTTDGVNYYMIATVGSSVTSYTVNGLVGNTTYMYRLRAVNGGGNSALITAQGQTAGPDTIVPKVSVTVQKTSKNYTFTATATDNIGIVKVEFWLDGKLIATDTSAAYTASVRLSSVTTGMHTIEARAFDKAGNVGRASVAFTK